MKKIPSLVKMIVFPRGPVEGPEGEEGHRYLFSGILVTSKPIPEVERDKADPEVAPGTLIVEGSGLVMEEVLRTATVRPPKKHVRDVKDVVILSDL